MSIDQHEFYLFLGPTLSIDEARQYLPDAHYLPPARCGDVLRISYLQPKVIVIIDGVFENEAAVWHKEILFCLEQGIQVFGASSMGALRAAELADFGMQGIGKIFEAFRDGTLNDDDEVAIIHTPCDAYISLTDAMVNIRATLENAVTTNIISKHDANLIECAAKKIFYRERTFSRALEFSKSMGITNKTAIHLTRWLHNGGFIDLKKQDAICLLNYLTKNSARYFSSNSSKLAVKRTVFLRNLDRGIMCQSIMIDKNDPLMKFTEKYFHNTGDYQLTCNLAYLLSSASALADKKQVPINVSALVSQTVYEQLGFKNSEFNCDSGIRASNLIEKETYINRIMRIGYLLDNAKVKNPDFNNRTTKCFISLLRLSNHYLEYKMDFHKFSGTIRFKIFKLISIIWPLLEIEVKNKQLKITDGAVKQYTTKFRKKNQHINQTTLLQWIKSNDLNLPEYYLLMRFYTSFSLLVLENNLEILDIFDYERSPWLSDAMRLSGNIDS